MNEETRAILESLQFLISMQKPESGRYSEVQSEIMSKIHLLLNPIESKSLQEETKEVLSE